jgi:hypothetical protein
MHRTFSPWLWLLFLLPGCGTTRSTDTPRSATEQLLVSKAVDETVGEMDFRCLAGKTVFFDAQYLDTTVVDRNYLISSLRQHLLASGALLQEDRTKATYVVEARSGGIGTDRNSVLIGVPQMAVPVIVPGQPSQIPEIPIAKWTDQKGVAKIAVFAYNRQTGRPVLQSGILQASSNAEDTWVLGLGPFQYGNVRRSTEFAGKALEIPFFDHAIPFFDHAPEETVVQAQHAVPAPTQSVTWSEPNTPPGKEPASPSPAPANGPPAAPSPAHGTAAASQFAIDRPPTPPSQFAADRPEPLIPMVSPSSVPEKK